MKEYDLAQWLLLFYIFSFCGWIFESSYVSILNKKFVNRGFLIGPWIPIYGFGGVIMLFVAIPFYANPLLVFLVGLAAATTLEYVTGVVMEKIFAIKYWDYTGKAFASKNGYICLESSLCWGVFTLILTYAASRWIDDFIYLPGRAMLLGIDAVLAALFTTDVYLSAKTALHIKNLSQLVAKANSEMGEILDKMPEDLIDIRKAFNAARSDGHITKEEWDDLLGKALTAAGDGLSRGRAAISGKLESIESSISEARKTADKRRDVRAAFRDDAIAEAAKRFEAALARRQKTFFNLDALTRRALNGNPSASSRLEGFDQIKKLAGEKKDKKAGK